MRRHLVPFAASLLLLSGCATAPHLIAIANPAPPPEPVAAPMPAGAYPGMVVPAALPDGSYPTPNRALTPDATIWHMRVALNVAALACRGADAPRIVTAYNAMLTARQSALKAAETGYAAEYKARGGDWRDAYDDAMTRLYNFFSQSPARDAFCATAATVLGEQAGVSDADLPGFASGGLARLDKPFTDFYRAYDAWRDGQVRPAASPLIAIAAPVPVAPTSGTKAPRLAIDASVFAAEQKPIS